VPFPSSPTENETYDDGQQVWQWKNLAWRSLGLTASESFDPAVAYPTLLSEAEAESTYLAYPDGPQTEVANLAELLTFLDQIGLILNTSNA
jgi:hypothetical protein